MRQSHLKIIGLIVVLATCVAPDVRSDESDLNVFGYFQTEFHQEDDSGVTSNTFLLQQLNLFFQKELGDDWNSFVNLEILNSFSSSRDWGSLELSEAWVSYHSSDQFKIKMGLHIPEFNNLNTIKNRSPLLPYIIRPFVYESSFSEFFNQDFLVPARAFLSIYGTIPSRNVKIDHAFYIGNSYNIRTGTQVRSIERSSAPQSGADTTEFLMLGGRLGARYKGFKLGVSGTYEKYNGSLDYAYYFNKSESNYIGMPLYRFGADFSYYSRLFMVESEYLSSKVDREFEVGLGVEANFYYVTLGIYVNDYLFLYGTVSKLNIDDFGVLQTITPPADTSYIGYKSETDVSLPFVGLSYNLNSRMTFKGQIMLVDIDVKNYFLNQGAGNAFFKDSRDINRFSVAVSAFF